MSDQQKEEFKRKLQKRGRQYPNLSRANNALITTPHKTSIPPNHNTWNNYANHQEREKEDTRNDQIWQSSNCCVTMA
jgi:hypothetical protein